MSGTWLATGRDARAIAVLLDAFNREFGTPTPAPEVLEGRLAALLDGPSMLAVLAGEPPYGLALVSLRPNAWSDGPVALLDELYVSPEHRNLGSGSELLRAAMDEARRLGAELLEVNIDAPDVDAIRFYERHGFSLADPGTGQLAYYAWSAL